MRLIPVTILFGLTLLGAGCVWGGRTVPGNGGVATTTNGTPTSTDTIDTADWQTYTNEEYGVSFMYPSDSRVSFNKPANSYSMSVGFNTLDGKASYLSITDLRKRKQYLQTNPTDDNILFDIEARKKFYLSGGLLSETEYVICDEPYTKIFGGETYTITLDCFSIEGFYTRMGFESFHEDMYISAWVDIGDHLLADGIVKDYKNKPDFNYDKDFIKRIKNPKFGKKSAEVIGQMEGILSSIKFNST